MDNAGSICLTVLQSGQQSSYAMKASEVMTKRVISIDPEASVVHAITTMLRNRISGLPVINAAARRQRWLCQKADCCSWTMRTKESIAMTPKLVILGTLVAVMLAASPADSASRTRHHQVRAVRPQRKIACTMLGCNSVPPGCEPVAGRTPGGMPTGFDIVVCPPGRVR